MVSHAAPRNGTKGRGSGGGSRVLLLTFPLPLLISFVPSIFLASSDRRRRADLAASNDVSTEAHEHTSPSVQMRAPSSSSAGGKGGGGGGSGRSGSREEEKARSPAMRGGGGGDDVWPNRSVNFGVGDGKDVSQKDMFLSASAEAECRNLQSTTPSMNATGGVGAKGLQGEARDYDIYDVNRTINRGSFRSSSSYTAGEMLRRGNDQIYDVIETSAAKSRGGAAAGMKEETNKLGVGVGSGSAGGSGNSGSFREEKALVQGFPDMSNRGLHPHSPSIGRAGSKEGMGVGVNVGMGMGLGMGGHQAVVPSMPIEQKVDRSVFDCIPSYPILSYLLCSHYFAFRAVLGKTPDQTYRCPLRSNHIS